MKILLVNTYYYPEIMGGAEISVQKLSEQLVTMGHDVHILCSGSENSEEKINGVNVIRRKPKNGVRNKDIYKLNKAEKICYSIFNRLGILNLVDQFNILNYRMFYKIIFDIKPDIIHTNGLYEITNSIWLAARMAGVPIIHTFRDYYLACKFATFRNPKTQASCCESSFICNFRRKTNKFLIKLVDATTAPSQLTIEKFQSLNYLNNINSAVIPNAIDFDTKKIVQIRNSREEHFLLNGSTSFVFLGTLADHKGLKWLIRSFHNIDDEKISLHIAGKGYLEPWVKKYVERDSRIIFHGFLNERDIGSLLDKCDVLICPSIWEEPFGRVILDAYKNVMPVIASNLGGLPEIITNNTGILITPNSEKELIDAIKNYSENRYRILNSYGHIVDYLNDFSVEIQAERFLEQYDKMQKRKY